MVQPVIQSTKHYNQFTPTTVASGTILNTSIVTAAHVADVTAASPILIPEGSIVKAVYIEMWITSDDAGQGSFQMVLEKIPAGATPPTFSIANSLTAYANKKNVLYVTRGLSSITTGTPIPVIRGWYKIPKGKQRFGLDDRLILSISAIANGMTFCGFFLYKSYQ